MTINEMQLKLYKIYQMDWLLKHGYKISDLMYAMEENPKHDSVSIYNHVTHFYEEWLSTNEELNDISDKRMMLSFYQFKAQCLNNNKIIMYLVSFVTLTEQKIILNMISSYNCRQHMRHSVNFYI